MALITSNFELTMFELTMFELIIQFNTEIMGKLQRF